MVFIYGPPSAAKCPLYPFLSCFPRIAKDTVHASSHKPPAVSWRERRGTRWRGTRWGWGTRYHCNTLRDTSFAWSPNYDCKIDCIFHTCYSTTNAAHRLELRGQDMEPLEGPSLSSRTTSASASLRARYIITMVCINILHLSGPFLIENASVVRRSQLVSGSYMMVVNI